jgi:ubiquinone/menaquinone biosynthesis C-methylase UbiE
MASSLDKSIYLAKAGVRRLRGLPGDLLASDHGGRLTPPKSLSFVGRGDFHQAGDEYLGHFQELGGLVPGDAILDMGCGIGRMAIPLMDFVDGGSYAGFDVSKSMIRWCERNITTRRPDFRFSWAPVHNRKYNPFGSVGDTEYRFPYADDSFDFAFATSLFTHMSGDAIQHYLVELARVLRPGGRFLVTFFVLTEDSRRAVADHRAAYEFVHPVDGGFTSDPRQPEAAMAFDEEVVEGMLRTAGLSLRTPIHHGQWAANPGGVAGQDIVVGSLAT